ncbi:hypothetical protein SAMN05720354_1246 [Nitrosospira sp. Nsp1]|nr:hypothetical protein SAMN05720354_1246 [Nitrosospira sp. Nsp1]
MGLLLCACALNLIKILYLFKLDNPVCGKTHWVKSELLIDGKTTRC